MVTTNPKYPVHFLARINPSILFSFVRANFGNPIFHGEALKKKEQNIKKKLHNLGRGCEVYPKPITNFGEH